MLGLASWKPKNDLKPNSVATRIAHSNRERPWAYWLTSILLSNATPLHRYQNEGNLYAWFPQRSYSKVP